MPSILIIDDDTTITTTLNYYFSEKGWETIEAHTGEEGIVAAQRAMPDVILLDMRLPDQDGIAVLRRLREQNSAASVIIMTGGGSIANAVEAVKLGAEQYLTKPFDITELSALTARLLETKKLRLENRYYRDRMDHTVVGASPEAYRLHHLIDLMAENADTTVLLLGESGTGKELAAREIHRRSPRRERPFLEINCAAIAETLMESEIFGHERGAFTDARERKHGLLEIADGGTVFLDEIGELPLAVQPKLLRVLETHSFKRVGGLSDIRVNVRIIAATNRDLAADTAAGRFRDDLFHRLNVFPITMPPLRDRPGDIPLLTEFFINHYNAALKRSCAGFTLEAQGLLRRYAWPGNVRELKNVIERAMVLSQEKTFSIETLPPEISGRQARKGSEDPLAQKGKGSVRTLEDVEREHILSALDVCSGNRSSAAKALGIARSTLQDKLKRYGLEERA